MVLLLLETIIVIMNNIRWCGWSLRCFLVVVRGLHRPFILIHHHKTKILLNRSLPSLFLLSLSLSLVVVVVGERKSDIKATMKFLFWGWYDFFPERFTTTKRRDSRHTQHSTTTRNNAITKKKQRETKKKDADDEVRTRAPVGYSVTVVYHWYSQCSYVGYLNAEIEIEVCGQLVSSWSNSSRTP